ncbi:hypothetical protein KR222_007907 [Zaprionus bogoriensis]|nr:hypothetical protein KR222_007907 [Zaprionus bogoriensis]
MEMPNENILDAYMRNPIEVAEPHPNNAVGPTGVVAADNAIPPETDDIVIERDVQSLGTFSGAGDGPHNNNQLIWEENVPPFVIVRGGHFSKLWYYMPTLILLSNTVFRCLLSTFGIDSNGLFLFGLSYTTHFNVMQWLTLFVMYYLK